MVLDMVLDEGTWMSRGVVVCRDWEQDGLGEGIGQNALGQGVGRGKLDE